MSANLVHPGIVSLKVSFADACNASSLTCNLKVLKSFNDVFNYI